MKGWRALLGERIGGLFLVGLGLAGLYIASRLNFGNVHQPGSGFYPVLVCVLLAALGALSLARADRAPAADSVSADGDGRIWIVIAALAVYTWALPKVGFVLCTVALLLLLLRGVGKVSWTGSAISAVVGSVATYAGLVRLGLPLPAGLLPF
jgi:hypothetical protein